MIILLFTAKAKAWAIPNLGVFFYQSGVKCMSKHIFPPLYILAVLPSNSGNSNSIGVIG